jgi:UDPglucose--hexose-1-phosphate uridylyltransferase
MAELRLDPIRRRWVVTGKRPTLPAAFDSGGECPFCPGHERFTPTSIYEKKGPDGGWDIRVFPDRSPLFRIEGGPDRAGEGIFDHMNALGAHEIVVGTRRHGVTLGQLSTEEIAAVLEVYRDRLLDLKRDHRLRYVCLFKVQGRTGALSQEHSYSQILATPVVPGAVEAEFRWSQFHFRRKERCILCDTLQQERESSLRVVDETPDFTSLCPYAARSPYELWILPNEHSSSFEQNLAAEGRPASLAAILKSSLQRIERISQRLRMVIHTEPNLDAIRPKEDWWTTIREDYHWHIEIVPELEGEPYDFVPEGFYFNPIAAEEAAVVLRALEPELAGVPPAE